MSTDSVEDDSNSNKPPLWKFVTVEGKISGGGNVRFVCNYCNKLFTGSYFRVKSHLLKIGGTGVAKCLKVSSNDLVMMQREQGEFETRAANSRTKQVPLPTSNSRTNSFSSSASTGPSMGTRLQGNDNLPLKRKKVTGDSPLEMAFNVQARQDLDSEIARMFYSSGLAFSLAKNPYYIASYTRAANSKHLAGYVPPGYNSLRTTLLAKERRHIEGLLEPLKAAWKEKGVSIVSDGNKITPKRGEDLVFVHSNLRLLSRQSPEYTKGESSMWDLGADGFDTLDDVGILGMANLSLDEPEMEAMLFTSDDTIDVDDEDLAS
ncbi:hypothetical protein CTI12_AA374770 [Artemisia annua]|uniref:BED-type domain-containing protein n=1 Tax=Artemisia annua TaxID=35608 RepID=A0A2U1MJ43_ARTAN|nr:hypothetical protein CTI12_AA374770 [Artemisia annua]